MTAPAFILGLQERGATLQLEGEALRVTPSTVLTDADRAAWREHKREITTLLEAALSSTRCEVQPGAPPFLVGVSDVEFCATRVAWIRRIGSAVWFMPLLAATVPSQSSTHIEPAQGETGKLYDPARAFAEANRLHRRGTVTREQRDALQRYALEFSLR